MRIKIKMQLKMHEESILEVLFVSQNRGLE